MKKTKNIKIKEYEKTSPWILNSKDILEVEKINSIAKINLFDIQANNVIKAKQYVWIVKINNKNIQVLPKIFWEEKEKILKNLLYMLSYTKKLKIKESDIANLGKVDDLFEVFIYLFAKNLLELLKKDFKKNYNKIEENSNFLKWKLLFTKHIKTNLFNKSKFFIEYEKMDENILLNIFLASTTEKLIKFTKSNKNIKLLKKIDLIFCDIERTYFKTAKILKKIKWTRQNKIYKNIFSLAKMLYFGNSPDFSKNNMQNFSILFDMNVLFEEFIWEFIKNNIQKFENLEKVELQKQNKYVFLENKFQLKPDIILYFKENKKIIIDTKYKKLDKDKYNNWVVSSDIYQMFMYWMRYFEDLEEKNIVLLYPEYNWINYNNRYTSNENINIFINTINLDFDLCNNEGREKLIEEIKKIFN